jgi:hypothetical protein
VRGPRAGRQDACPSTRGVSDEAGSGCAARQATTQAAERQGCRGCAQRRGAEGKAVVAGAGTGQQPLTAPQVRSAVSPSSGRCRALIAHVPRRGS